jgi:D-amino peptidase
MTMKNLSLLASLIVLWPHASAAQSKGLKVFISADMEGVGGVSTWDVQASPKGREYDQFRRLMTREVNAAIQGAFDAGATEIVVADSHGDAQNIDVELLDRRATLVRAWPRPLGMMQGIDSSFAAVVFIGYHAREGRADATLAHDFSGDEVIKVNGVEVPEAGFNAAIAGDFGVPVVFLSGDQTICEDARQMFGPIETVTVKQALGFHSAVMMTPEKSQGLIRKGVKRAVERRKDMKRYTVSHPVKVEDRFNQIAKAEVAAYIPGVERVNGNTVVFTVPNMTVASKLLWAIGAIKP